MSPLSSEPGLMAAQHFFLGKPLSLSPSLSPGQLGLASPLNQ